jgi:hypothetical protein
MGTRTCGSSGKWSACECGDGPADSSGGGAWESGGGNVSGVLQAIDVADRSITKQLTVHDALAWGALIRRDASYNGVVVAGQKGGDVFPEEYPGYLVKWYSLD